MMKRRAFIAAMAGALSLPVMAKAVVVGRIKPSTGFVPMSSYDGKSLRAGEIGSVDEVRFYCASDPLGQRS